MTGRPTDDQPPLEGEEISNLPVKHEENLPDQVVETAGTAMASREKAAVEARILAAKKFPRNPDQARQDILGACRRPKFAESVQYAKPVGGGKKATGLSIRAAEEAFRAWGNLYIRADVVFDDRERRIYRVTGTDLQTNSTTDQDVIVEKTVERRQVKEGDEVIGSRINSTGQKVYLKVATEDEILTKANAGLSKARRNLILSLIPSDIREEMEETALDTLRTRDAKDPTAARKQILDGFYRVGVTADQVKALMGKPLETLNPAEIQLLRNIYTGLRDGEMNWADVEADEGLQKMRTGNGGEKDKPNGATKGTAGLKNKVQGTTPAAEAPAPAVHTEAEELKLDKALAEKGK